MKGTVCILLAAGQGARMNAGKNKVLLRIGNASVLEHSLRAVIASQCFERVYVVCKNDERAIVSRLMRRMHGAAFVLVTGGERRQDSVKNAIDAIGSSAEIIAVHDAARCFASPELIRACVRSAAECGSGVAGKRAVDTIKLLDGERIVQTLQRDNIALIETPQVFSASLIRAAYERAEADGFLGTDDASLVERLGVTPRLVESREENIKLTHKKDLKLGEFLMSSMGGTRIGQGVDFHEFKAGRRLILGGVDIPHEKGLLGHSDADVLIHAVMDALLGAAAMGDIGRHFPDTDAQYRGISSMVLLEKTGRLLAEKGIGIVNIDATVIMQAPKIAQHTARMEANIAGALKIEAQCVSVKATTTEGMGFAGRGEGASAMAVCLISHR